MPDLDIDSVIGDSDLDTDGMIADTDEDDFQVTLSDIGEEDKPGSDSTVEDNDETSSDDMDLLLGDADSDGADEFDAISQGDIDSLLNDEDEDEDAGVFLPDSDTGDEESRNIISQDDIDLLLAGSDEDDEDLLADMENDEDLDLESDFEDDLDIERKTLEDEASPVILEEPETSDNGTSKIEIEHLADQEEGGDSSAKKRSFLKIILLLFLVLIIIGGCVAGVYFFFIKEKVSEDSPPVEQSVSEEQSDGGMDIDKSIADTNLDEEEAFNPGSMTLEGFVILTPDQESVTTYISGDLVIDYSYSKVFHEINNRLPYYRYIIYEAITNGLKHDKDARLTENDLLDIIKNALNQALPGMKIDKVIFTEFKTG